MSLSASAGRGYQCCSPEKFPQITVRFEIPAAIYRSAQGPGDQAGKCPTECLLSAFAKLGTWVGVPQGVLFGTLGAQKAPKSTQKTLFGALRARCPKALKKHSVGHFPAWSPGHSCKWRLGSKDKISQPTSSCKEVTVSITKIIEPIRKSFLDTTVSFLRMNSVCICNPQSHPECEKGLCTGNEVMVI